MNKLSQEQAEWLIEKIKKHDNIHRDAGGGCTSCIYAYDVEETINQCTEKEFPEFNLEYPKGKISISENDNRINIGFVDIMGSLRACGNLYIPKERFKQFTQGCNEIVKWLEEQE